VKLKELSPLGKQKLSNFGEDFNIAIELMQMCTCGEKRNIIGCVHCKGVLKE
jgi:hypothetical protein